MTTEPINTRKIMAEIEADARARRVSGEIPKGYEAELDEMFERLVPKGGGGDFESAISQAEAQVFFDYAPPVASAKKGGAFAKKGLSKVSGWYIRYVGHQVSAFASSIASATRLLGERLDRIEAVTYGASSSQVSALAAEVLPLETNAAWNADIVEHFKGETGRVLVARAGNGDLVRELNAATISAYGVEPGDPARIEDVDPTLDIRSDELLPHLQTIPEPELAGLVLNGIPDQLSVGGALNLLEKLPDVLMPGALLVVVVTDPEQWRRVAGGIAADLSPVRPMAPTTWVELLAMHGYTEIDVASADPQPLVQEIPGSDAAATALNESLRALEAALQVPPSHRIVARLPR